MEPPLPQPPSLFLLSKKQRNALAESNADVRALLAEGGELKGQLRAPLRFRERQICFREASADEARPEQKKALNADQPY